MFQPEGRSLQKDRVLTVAVAPGMVPAAQVGEPVLETVAAARDPGKARESVQGLGRVIQERVRAGLGTVVEREMVLDPVAVAAPAEQELAVEPEKATARKREMAVVPVAVSARVQAVVVPAQAAARVALADRVPAATATCCFSSWK